MVIRTTNKFSPLAPHRSGPVGVMSVALSVALLTLGCHSAKKAPETEAAPQGSAEVASPAAPSVEKKASTPTLSGSPYPQGPQFIIIPGKGFGPIRFGATFETVERHMGAPCDQKTETRCLYVRQAAEFTFKDGVVVKMKAHIRGRVVQDGPPDKDKAYGSFYGAVAPKIMLGLHRHIVLEEFGEPERKEPVVNPPELGLVERHIYDGLTFEYDKIQNGNIVLGGIEVTASKTAPPSGPKNADGVKKATAEVKEAAPKTQSAPLKAKSPPATAP